MNERQREAVLCTEGPLLVLAGAGSGKTRVLTHRIAYLIDELGVEPYRIMAITFTNKAAGEMKERVLKLVDFGDAVWVATFHSTCVRILRRYIDLIGYDTNFTIYDTDDQKTVLRHVIKDLGLDPKMYKERTLAAFISACKNEAKTPDDVLAVSGGDYLRTKQAEIYRAYEKRLKENNALDFDDLLLKTVELFEAREDVLQSYQRRFRYVMVDEYQDTNEVQFRLLYLLTKAHRNLMVVGDDDQSIYRFRGADIRNILDFETHFPGAKVVKLEQNYRSTTSILEVANSVIRHNKGRKEKHLWSELGAGEKVSFRLYDSAMSEAEEIIRRIAKCVRNGEGAFREFAVLYRTNNQSRLFEEKCIARNVPYTLVGGVNFYQRAEIKDLLAYLKTIDSGRDSLSTARILNRPRRGIGDSTLEKLEAFADREGLSLMEAIQRRSEVPGIERAERKLGDFARLIQELRIAAKEESLPDLLRLILEKTDYRTVFDDLEDDKAEEKEENLEELISKATDFVRHWEGEENPTLGDFLEEVALIADIDSVEESDDRVLLMTMHGAKGLEFPTVFLTGMEEGMFPSYMSLDSEDPYAIEEERRLCYVGMTRAKRQLFLSAARYRTVNGSVMHNDLSRFVREIPEDLLETEGQFKKAERSPSGAGSRFSCSSGNAYSGNFRQSNAPYGSGRSTPGAGEKAAPKRETFGMEFKVEKLTKLDYREGDRVRHFRFGEGTVKEIVEGTRDFEVTVQFDAFGEKRMFASFAKLVKI